MKKDIKSLTINELEMEMEEIGEKKFRAKQVYVWLHQKNCSNFEQMTNVSAQLRSELSQRYCINSIQIKKKLVSTIDNTVKYLYELMDGNHIEAVLMKYKHGNSLCISTQVGCRMGCKFCASTLSGLVRNLTAAEMLDEVYCSAADSGEKVSSIVLMGIGEPLDNFDNVVKFMNIVSSPDGINLSLRHVSLSTCGIVDKIDKLSELGLGLTLSISLHAPNDAIRNQTMPINAKWNIDSLIASTKRYFDTTGRRISFEYALIDGVNDSKEHARMLADKLKKVPHAHVNLIPVNPVCERNYKKSLNSKIFMQELLKNHVNATVRRELGSDINAACGQLRNEHKGGTLT